LYIHKIKLCLYFIGNNKFKLVSLAEFIQNVNLGSELPGHKDETLQRYYINTANSKKIQESFSYTVYYIKKTFGSSQ